MKGPTSDIVLYLGLTKNGGECLDPATINTEDEKCKGKKDFFKAIAAKIFIHPLLGSKEVKKSCTTLIPKLAI